VFVESRYIEATIFRLLAAMGAGPCSARLAEACNRVARNTEPIAILHNAAAGKPPPAHQGCSPAHPGVARRINND
jgi:hypothetical protein